MDKMLKTKEFDSTLSKKTYVAPQMTVEEFDHQCALLECSGTGDVCIEGEE